MNATMSLDVAVDEDGEVRINYIAITNERGETTIEPWDIDETNIDPAVLKFLKDSVEYHEKEMDLEN